jgi:hypothetical protein
MQTKMPIRFWAACLVVPALTLTACDQATESLLEPDALSAHRTHGVSTAQLASGLAGGTGSTIGPGRALFVTENAAGRISRIDRKTGEATTFAEGLPQANPDIGLGGAMDVAFIGHTAYALTGLVAADVGGTDVVGIYRVDGPNSSTVIADIGAFNLANPPETNGEWEFFVPTGVPYALQAYRGGFLVTDGHLNRVLRVKLNGEITVFRAFGNIVPTGLDVRDHRVFMAQAGPVPHMPENGKVVSFWRKSHTVRDIASGAPLLVDVEFGRGRTLFALSQGDFPDPPTDPGTPALPNTGALVKVTHDGSFAVVAEGLNLPASFEIVGNTAYVLTLTGEIWEIRNISGSPYGDRGRYSRGRH